MTRSESRDRGNAASAIGGLQGAILLGLVLAYAGSAVTATFHSGAEVGAGLGLFAGAFLGSMACLRRLGYGHAAATGALTGVLLAAVAGITVRLHGIGGLVPGATRVEHLAAGFAMVWIGLPLTAAAAVLARTIVLSVLHESAHRGSAAGSVRPTVAA
jgi:hypothetical protein